MPRSVVAGALLGMLAPSALARAQPAALPPAYEAVVARYARGDHEGAIAALGAFPEGRLRYALGATLTSQRVPAAAALMLHTDCAIRAWSDATSPRLHESLALEIASRMKDDRARA